MGETVTFTHCHLCEQMCGLAVTVADGRIAAIRPDKANPYSWRDFCTKAQRAGDVVHSPHRVLQPMKRDGTRFVAASYEEAVDDVAARLKAIIARHGPDAVGGYVGNPGGLNAGAGAFHNAFLKALETRQQFSMYSIDTNAYHVASLAMFGVEWLTLIPDIDAADCAVLIGTNPAISKSCWLGTVPNGWRRLLARVRDGADLIVIDPRRTETADHATLHLAPRPESDWALVLAMLRTIFDNGWERLPERGAIAGLAELRALAASADPTELAAICDVPLADIAEAARRFALAPRGYAMAATGPALGRNGVISHWLVLALNVVTGRIDVPGGRYLPAWPLNMTAYRQEFTPPMPVPSRVRGIPSVLGWHSIAELADEIETPGSGQVRALFITGGNPVSSSAHGERLARALGGLDLLVALDMFRRESHRHADWLIPGQHFLERDELLMAWSQAERPFVQAARAALPSPQGIRPEWTFFRDLADALGLKLFGGQMEPHPDALAEALFAYGGQTTLAETRAAEHGLEFGERSMGHLWDYLAAQGTTVALCPGEFVAELHNALAQSRTTGGASFQIISRRRNNMMNGWLAETSGSVADDPTASSVEMNPGDAARIGLADGAQARIASRAGELVATVAVSDAVRPGTLVIASGWGAALYDPVSGAEVFRKGIERNKLVADDDLGPLSGVPRLNGTPVTISAVQGGA